MSNLRCPSLLTPLFRPLTLRGITVKNRIVISPMCQYSAVDGMVNDWHLVHLGKFAQGGAGMVMTEAVAVTPEGRITHGDLGLWHDGQIAPLERIAAFLRDNGAVPAIQLAHAGRKGSMQRPWFGNAALTAEDRARGDDPWRVVAPSPIPMDDGWLMPAELAEDELEALCEQWAHAALRAADAGFELLEAALRPRLSAALLPVAAVEPPHRRVWRQPRGTDALSAAR